MMRKSVHVIVRGRVQGVGFRAFVAREAEALGLDGWTRNRRSGTVEVVVSGEAETVDRMLAALRGGPPGSLVSDASESDYPADLVTGFRVLPTE